MNNNNNKKMSISIYPTKKKYNKKFRIIYA